MATVREFRAAVFQHFQRMRWACWMACIPGIIFGITFLFVQLLTDVGEALRQTLGWAYLVVAVLFNPVSVVIGVLLPVVIWFDRPSRRYPVLCCPNCRRALQRVHHV